ncbi:MAG: PPC domain-containing protein [Myxococcota bacterium]|nr:PPC domain-containing protein [Myxococcota bacterium]MDW8360930.1 PPC domain-containing protein [Myxococcales bacterium]
MTLTRASKALLSTWLVACAAHPGDPLAEVAAETGLEGPLDAIPDEAGKFDTAGAVGPRVPAGVATEVWAVRNDWNDRDSAEARRAGIAWGENSGLDWEQKYDRWIASLQTVPRAAGGLTFRIRTPYGERQLDAPTLECAEVALVLRALFASWHGLPFFVAGWDSNARKPLYAGHFGFVHADGSAVAGFPAFKSSYADYSASWRPGQAWPRDERLRARRLGNDDGNAFLGGAGAGAYFDELLLNKRVGHFLRLLLVYFGSANLADGANMFHIVPEAIAPGDVLLQRWQRRGIGHTLPVMRVEEPSPGRFSVAVATGSMPRRQPLWESGEAVRWYFTAVQTGGEGTNGEGEPYAKLGGGLRRWRTARLVNGRWTNVVRAADQAAYIADTDIARIAARPARFGEILARVSPEEQRDAARAAIEAARVHLRSYPASCSARTRREEAFERLYAVMAEYFGMSRAEVDATERTLEDYVFGELVYTESKTCCWNSTNEAMARIVLDYAAAEQAQARERGMCIAPTVFRFEAGRGYERWAEFARATGRGALWKAWSEDEPCAQRNVPEDRLAPARAVPWCERPGTGGSSGGGSTGGGAGTGRCTDALEPNDDRGAARIVTPGSYGGLKICGGESDWFRIEAPAGVVTRVSIAFRHASGDLDMEAVGLDGSRLGSSEGTGDSESVSASGTFLVRVYGYAGAQGGYTLTVSR